MPAGARRGLRFNILGPLEGWEDGRRLRLGGTIRERVLVTLLLETGKVLPVSRLVAAVWAEDPPATASHQVRKAVAELRRSMLDGGEVLVTDGPGYRAALGDGQLDLTEFGALVRAARQAALAGRPAEAVEALRGALALWRGPVLSGAGGPVIEAAATALDEHRLAAAEQLFELRLGLGESAELVVDLRQLVHQHPLRETLRGQLMLALYRSGRQAEALEEYGRVRELLVEELGIDPGPSLARIHQGILRDSPELAAVALPSAVPVPVPALVPSSAASLPADPSSAVPLALTDDPLPVVHPVTPADSPSTLPYDLADFTGRDRELRELLACAQQEGEPRTRIVAIDGMGGSGKTSLAVRAAHRLAGAYPDGQLHIDLRGHAPGEPPVSAGTALHTLLRALGLPGDRIPEDVSARTALWRATLVGRRLLLLLDNAADAAAVRPLLPSSPGCLVLVTSRARLVDLDGARWISIDVLAPEESASLVTEILGAARIAAEPEAAAELARLCGHLPLALRIATARLRNRPRWTLRYLADRLRDETRRLDELSSGERSVAATLRLSYQTLDEQSRSAFRLLALHPGGDLDVYSAAALLGSAARSAESVLELLLDVHLLQQPEIGLYTFHDLVRSFAQSLRGGPTEAADAAAVERLLDYYLTATEAACEQLFPGRRSRPTGIPASSAELPGLADTAGAQAWFTREHAALRSAVALAERHGYDRHTVCLARNVMFQLNARGHLDEFQALGRIAVTAARRLGDLALLGVSLANLGVACWKLGHFTEGIEVAQEARDVAARLGDRHTEAHSESTLGLYKSLLGRFAEALTHLTRAVAHERELGSIRAEAESLTLLSALYEQWGRYREAAEAARRAVELGRQLGRHENELVALTDLAFALLGLGDYAEAAQCLGQARELCDETKEPGQVALALALSAEVADRLGCPEQAAGHLDRALALIGSSSSPLRRAKVENTAGRLLHRRGEHASALALHRHAHELAAAIDYRTEEAYALAGLAQAAQALGEPGAADHRVAAERLFTALGVPADRRRG
ncbi:AfsR/SARP family transcriptional regulator [Kitasatospora kifunensis]|uniref:DNA-binding SARP family transcriptional activator n=1 Tax=Kitasatospora kifunensis TaxID=58351 RepID=A0A7W7QX51_KITKI|nr:BTAD domain-containing putative transcriptional regulator [Kitasatospora kifunensis]MBB4921445.1 DNA-binding SARP family transcriptional activator [Kitasatospora kifunensis]